MSVLNIPEELIELRSSLRQFVDREVTPVEEQHRQEIQETGTFTAYKDDGALGKDPSLALKTSE